MIHQIRRGTGRVSSGSKQQRIAVVGAGLGGLSCAHELRLRGHHPVVFEASDRLGGRCSARHTPVGWFDDGAQAITGITRLASYATQQPDELAAIHPWTVPTTQGDDDAEVIRTLKLMGAVGVPSMRVLANAVARPLDVRLNTPIRQAWRCADRWLVRDAAGEIDDDFDALVLALPAPLALPLALASPVLAAALAEVRYVSRWVLLLASDRPVGLPRYREFQGSPIERVAAMHSKPGRPSNGPERWFVEADGRWSMQHEDEEAEAVAELLLDNLRAHASRPVTPTFIRAHLWRHAFVETPAARPGRADCLWDDELRMGVCGDSVVSSRVDLVHRSGAALAARMEEGLAFRADRSVLIASGINPRGVLESQAAHG